MNTCVNMDPNNVSLNSNVSILLLTLAVNNLSPLKQEINQSIPVVFKHVFDVILQKSEKERWRNF